MKELMELPIWVCWNYRKINGQLRKKPFAADGRPAEADESHQDTWITYKEALSAKKSLNYSGIGFIIPKEYFFLDIDARTKEDPYAAMLLERFDTYAEQSVSGTGLHIYGKCDLSRIPTYTDKTRQLRLDKAFYIKHPKTKIELYIGGLTGRFAAFTGNYLVQKPLQDCTDALLLTLDKDMRRKSGKRYSPKQDGDDSQLFDIIANQRKQKNGKKFVLLFDKGDISGYNSHSEADCALCAIIAFRTGNAPKQIDAVFRQSALYCEKWKRGRLPRSNDHSRH